MEKFHFFFFVFIDKELKVIQIKQLVLIEILGAEERKIIVR
jgi:hypothetical protein